MYTHTRRTLVGKLVGNRDQQVKKFIKEERNNLENMRNWEQGSVGPELSAKLVKLRKTNITDHVLKAKTGRDRAKDIRIWYKRIITSDLEACTLPLKSWNRVELKNHTRHPWIYVAEWVRETGVLNASGRHSL